MLEAAPPRYPAPEWSGSGSEEEDMSTIVLTQKAAKLMKLCDLEGYKRLHDLLKASASDGARARSLLLRHHLRLKALSENSDIL
jgi:hypothetical protein